MNTPTIYTATPADLSPPVQTDSFCVDLVLATDYQKLKDEFKQLAAENVALKKSAPAPFSKLMMEALDTYHSKADDVPELAMLSAYVRLRDGLKTPATDRIVAGIKADGVEMFALMFAEEAIKDNNITTGWKARASRAASEYAELLREGAK